MIKKIAKKVILKGIVIAVFMSSLQSLAAIPYRNAYEHMDVINQQTKELNLGMLAQIQVVIDQNRLNMASYIPYANLNEGTDEAEVAQKVFTQTLKTLIDETQNSTSSLSSLAKDVSFLQTGLAKTVGTSEHQFSVSVNAIETTAEIQYKGVVSAQLSYDISKQDTTFELSKKVGPQTYAYTHVENTQGVSDNIGVRWSF